MNISKFIKKVSMTVAGTAFVAFSGTTIAQAISITTSNNGNQLVSEILGSGITVEQDSINYIGADGASGIFTNGLSSGIGIDQGIILTTGTAMDAKGPNSLDHTTTKNKLPGDPDLDGLITESRTQDATILEFDFETQGGNVFFEYVFASEEYNEFVNTNFNDVFGFFLNGKNIALIPGTNTPVAINTVNNGNPEPGQDPTPSNSEFFNNNDPIDGEPLFDIEYDGFTNVFTAQALGLESGSHSIKLAIADTGDQAWDSAVFIQARSFSDRETYEPSTDEDILGEPPVENTEDVSEPPTDEDIWEEPPVENTEDVSEPPTVEDILGEPPVENTEDVFEA
ncbi:choice-of-anchor L domain-containing protein, partial [Dapis sp. BLCC M172]|uniref:choice-of-anchor L domain-containing protein n=1 Tax=Dapis sp. BLCC M172 TaxID=2975281 RepID=UPI003CEE531C